MAGSRGVTALTFKLTLALASDTESSSWLGPMGPLTPSIETST